MAIISKWVFPLHHQLKPYARPHSPCQIGKDLGRVFGLNHGYVYVGVTSENMTFVPDCRTIAEYMGGSFVDFPT